MIKGVGIKWSSRSPIVLAKRWNSTKPFYITTPIFYVNAKPHLGHLYSMLLGDTRIRWEKLDPTNKAYFLTGTDEHGLKIQAAAEKLNMEPKELVDQVSQNFKNLAEVLNVNYDRFMRTTDADHAEVVKYFWNLMMEKGYIYEGSHSGWYSISDETFYPETQIEEIIDKDNNKKMIAKESRNEVVYQDEINYFFRLSKFQDQLLKHFEANPEFILPTQRYNQILKELRETKFEDLSISRPSSRLKWSIEVPNDPSQKIYVWFDALLNYITATGYPQAFTKTDDGYITPQDNPWPATHIVGKDIIKFHCIYWPIFLMAAGVDVPKQVIVHSHWLSDGFKMSKSLGNVVDPLEMLAYYGQDSIRFFLMENSNIDDDCKFSENLLVLSRDMIIGKYANLVTRIGGKSFNIRESIEYYHDKKYEGINELIEQYSVDKSKVEELIKTKDELIIGLDSIYEKMNEKIIKFDYIRAIQEWWLIIDKANYLFQNAEPWLLVKQIKQNKDDIKVNEQIKVVINFYTFLASETSRISSILINPVMPGLSTKILDRLGVEQGKRFVSDCKIGKDLSYGVDANSTKHKLPIERVEIRGNSVEK
ncbi:tRNA synthetases class I (M)-domain-containing protein [Scheffersomyces coipomensis]|uniref:tRNA synthetases class I (M)-domain-containing protein n=1 Tax=Scheffersomyces coipomensis TaxID=1788519 RepID=UPI00315D23C3